MSADDLFSVVSPDEADRIRSANGMWKPVIEALGDGDTLLVRIPTASVGGLSREMRPIYPTKRLVSRKSDDPEYRYLWLVDR